MKHFRFPGIEPPAGLARPRLDFQKRNGLSRRRWTNAHQILDEVVQFWFDLGGDQFGPLNTLLFVCLEPLLPRAAVLVVLALRVWRSMEPRQMPNVVG